MLALITPTPQLVLGLPRDTDDHVTLHQTQIFSGWCRRRPKCRLPGYGPIPP